VLALGILYAIKQALVSQVWKVVFIPIPYAGMFVGATVALAWIAAVVALSRVLHRVGR